MNKIITLLVASAQGFRTGTNIGGWMVLEPWITPSLFYRFLGKGQKDTALDSWTLCETLGPVEGNKLMRAHWDTWYTADHIKQLSMRGVDMVRLPIGDWTLQPYGPYVGCMDGAVDYIDAFFDIAAMYNIQVWMDVHTAVGSQNGFDNSGRATSIVWNTDNNYTHFGEAFWIGQFNGTAYKYEHINYDHLQFTLNNSELLLQRWGSHSAFGAFQPVNEPWWNTPLGPLKDLYRKVRKLVQRYAPQAHFVFHDAFIYDPATWNDLFRDDDVDKVALDHHYYWAFGGGQTNMDQICIDTENESAKADQIKYEVWFGEWALATDNCAQHLNGLNDGQMKNEFKCAQMACPKTYLPDAFAVDFDRNADIIGPFGSTGDNRNNSIQKGNCFTDSLYFDWAKVKQLADCSRTSFEKHLNGSFMWTAHNEIEARWDYIRAWDMMWINKTEVPEAQQKKYPDFDPVTSIETSDDETTLKFI